MMTLVVIWLRLDVIIINFSKSQVNAIAIFVFSLHQRWLGIHLHTLCKLIGTIRSIEFSKSRAGDTCLV